MEAFVTLLYEDSYLPGVLVLGHRLREVGVGGRKLVVLVTNGVSLGAKALLEQVYDQVINVESISNHGSGVEEEFALLKRPELDRVFTKINAWRLDQFAKCVFLDADILVLKHIVELFSDEVAPVNKHTIAGAPDVGWPDIFNSGVFVFQPDHQVFEELLDASLQGESFDGGDQGLLNQYFERPGKHWHRLPFTYNVTPSMSYQYTPAFRYFEHKVSIVHFTGTQKPWKDAYHKYHHVYEGSSEFVSRWWDIASRHGDVAELLRPAPLVYPYAHVEPGPEPEEHHEEPEEVEQQQQQQHGPDPRFDAFGGYAQSAAQTVQPSIDRWDPVRSVPPRGSQPEAMALVIEQYQNAWDQPYPPPAQFVEQHNRHEDRSHVHFAVDDEQHMAHFVDEEHHHHHHHHHNHGHGHEHHHPHHHEHHDEQEAHEEPQEEEPNTFVQDFGPSIFKFPWEQREDSTRSERVFPGYEPVHSEPEESELDSEHDVEPDLLDVEEEEEEEEEEEYHDESGYDTDVAHQEEDEVRLGIAKPGFHNFKDRGNAWDTDPHIQNYMTRHVRRTSSMGIEDIIGNHHRRQRSVGGAGDDATTKFDEDNDDDEAVPDLVWKKSSEGNKRYQFPVTPNPIRNPFPPDHSDDDEDDEGGEYDSDSSLPSQAQWDPAAKLEELAKLPALLLQQKLLSESEQNNSLAPSSSPPPPSGVSLSLNPVSEPEVSQSELTPDREVEESSVVKPVDIANVQLTDKSNEASAYRKAGGTDDDVTTAVTASASSVPVPLAPPVVAAAPTSDDSANNSSGSDTESKRAKASSLFRKFSKKA